MNFRVRENCLRPLRSRRAVQAATRLRIRRSLSGVRCCVAATRLQGVVWARCPGVLLRCTPGYSQVAAMRLQSVAIAMRLQRIRNRDAAAQNVIAAARYRPAHGCQRRTGDNAPLAPAALVSFGRSVVLRIKGLRSATSNGHKLAAALSERPWTPIEPYRHRRSSGD
jgi:hypothetical protein